MTVVQKIYFCIEQKDLDENVDLQEQCDAPGWYWSDEIEQLNGPVGTLEEAIRDCTEYAKYL